MQLYGAEFVGRWGTADNWPAWAQLEVARQGARLGTRFHAVAEHRSLLRPALTSAQD